MKKLYIYSTGTSTIIVKQKQHVTAQLSAHFRHPEKSILQGQYQGLCIKAKAKDHKNVLKDSLRTSQGLTSLSLHYAGWDVKLSGHMETIVKGAVYHSRLWRQKYSPIQKYLYSLFTFSFRFLAERCHCIKKFGYCHSVLSFSSVVVVCLWFECIVTKLLKPGSRGFRCSLPQLFVWWIWWRN